MGGPFGNILGGMYSQQYLQRHQQARFAEFKHRFETELAEPERAEALRHLRDDANTKPLTLLTATKDLEQSALACERPLPIRSARHLLGRGG